MQGPLQVTQGLAESNLPNGTKLSLPRLYHTIAFREINTKKLIFRAIMIALLFFESAYLYALDGWLQ